MEVEGGGAGDNSAKKERKLLPKTVEQKEGQGARKSLARERKRRAGLVIVQRYLLLPV